MVDVLRKHVAPAYRILVSAKAFLNTTIADGVFYFTASQIELMRNLVDYANRRTTFVSDYYIGYYLSPDDTDWDLIQAIVADLENTLMGNPNTLWGYLDRLADSKTQVKSGDGDHNMTFDTCPEGEVWIVNAVCGHNGTTACQIEFTMLNPSYFFPVHIFESSGIDEYSIKSSLSHIMKEGDYLRVTFRSCIDGDSLSGKITGYKMSVPE